MKKHLLNKLLSLKVKGQVYMNHTVWTRIEKNAFSREKNGHSEIIKCVNKKGVIC